MRQSQDQIPFTIIEYKFERATIAIIKKGSAIDVNAPLVYIITSKKEPRIAYIGESTKIITRLNKHLSGPKKDQYDTLHLIVSSRFHRSGTADLEHMLITYMFADEFFRLTNSTYGLTSHNYFEKEAYMRLFPEVWNNLKKIGIACYSIRDINNEDLFKYSPFKQLTDQQYRSMETIIQQLLKNDNNATVVHGAAGTGKTVLAMFLMKLLALDINGLLELKEGVTANKTGELKQLKEKFPNPKVALVVPVLPNRITLQKVFEKVIEGGSKLVISPFDVTSGNYDILIVDETHRLSQRRNLINYSKFDEINQSLGLANGTQLDWILQKSKNQIFFYDKAQTIQPSDIEESDFNNIVRTAKHISIDHQLRVRGGATYVDYIEKLLTNQLTASTPVYESSNYEFLLFEKMADLMTLLYKREKEYRLCRLLAGYGWDWKSGTPEASYDFTIEGMPFKWNTVTTGWIHSPNAFHEVGTVHSVQGYELNYAGIIFGPEITYNRKSGQIEIIPENYKDKRGKAGIHDPSRLKEYVLNVYRILLLRSIYGTYIYACDHELRKYLKKYVKIFRSKEPRQ